MKTDKHKTKVQFFIENELNPDLTAQPFAFFPEIEEGRGRFNNEKLCLSYAHFGQHSACSVEYIKECKKATPEQYKDLKEELTSIGYNLKIV
jgi:hypothetical protein